jgi:hypothetical protein
MARNQAASSATGPPRENTPPKIPPSGTSFRPFVADPPF